MDDLNFNLSLSDMFFDEIQCGIQPHCDHAQDHDGHEHPGEFKCLRAVDDQLTEPLSCTDKFSDDHTNQA